MKKIFLLLAFSFVIKTFSQSLQPSRISCSNYEEQLFNDPEVDYSMFKSFSLVSVKHLLKDEEQPLLEKHIEFSLSNLIYSKCNLNYVPFNDTIKPDLLIVYDYSNNYEEKYIAPRTLSIPHYQPGQTTTSRTNSSNSGSINTYGDINISGNAYSNNQSTTTTTTQGEWSIKQIEKPGYTVGKYYPMVSLVFYNTANDRKIWEGTASGTSDNKDFRLAGQYLMTRLAVNIPKGSFVEKDFIPENNLPAGIDFILFNTDGQNYYPLITNTIKNSVASKNGLVDYDVLLSINGTSTANKSVKQIKFMLKEACLKAPSNVQVERNGRIIEKTMIKKVANNSSLTQNEDLTNSSLLNTKWRNKDDGKYFLDLEFISSNEAVITTISINENGNTSTYNKIKYKYTYSYPNITLINKSTNRQIEGNIDNNVIKLSTGKSYEKM